MNGFPTDGRELRRFLHGLPGVDEVGALGRVQTLKTRSIKTTSKAWAIDTAISMVDLTTLEGADTPGKVRALCAKALRPDPTDPSTPPVAAVCVYGDLVGVARLMFHNQPELRGDKAKLKDLDTREERPVALSELAAVLAPRR